MGKKPTNAQERAVNLYLDGYKLKKMTWKGAIEYWFEKPKMATVKIRRDVAERLLRFKLIELNNIYTK